MVIKVVIQIYFTYLLMSINQQSNSTKRHHEEPVQKNTFLLTVIDAFCNVTTQVNTAEIR